MTFPTSLFLSLLFCFTPVAFCRLLLPLLCQDVVVSIPRSFLVPHLVLALLARPLLDIAANIWLLFPIVPVLATAPAFFTVFVGLAFSFLLSAVVQNATAIVRDNFLEVNPFRVKENLRRSVERLFSSLEVLLGNANFTEMLQNVKLPRGVFREMFASEFRENDVFETYNFSEAFSNLTISESTYQHIDVINTAVIGLLENVHVSTLFNRTRIPQDLQTSFDAVSEALRDLAQHLNIAEIIRDGNIPSQVQDSLSTVGDALESLGHSFNLTELFETAVSSSPAAEEAFKPFLSVEDPAAFFQTLTGTASPGESISDFFSWVPLGFHIIAGAYILLLGVGVPLAFFLRAAMQDGFLWLVTRRYESNIPSAQRSASGWMLVAATSGLALALTEALPYCCFYAFLYGSNVLRVESVFVFLIHSMTAAPFRAASQMRIAEVGARRDVLKDPKPRFLSGFVWAAFTNTVFHFWWMFSASILIFFITTGRIPIVVLCTDALAATFAVMWGRRICNRLLRDERVMIEDRERKSD